MRVKESLSCAPFLEEPLFSKENNEPATCWEGQIPFPRSVVPELLEEEGEGMEQKLKAAEDSALRRMQSISDAKDAVRPYVGEVRANLAQDDAASIFGAALDALGELTGRTAREEIVSRIFSRFCVGK